jgi:hypothetical protein
MTASTRPTFIPRTDWRVVPVILSADEQAALNTLARSQRRDKADMAALLIRQALEDRELLEEIRN